MFESLTHWFDSLENESRLFNNPEEEVIEEFSYSKFWKKKEKKVELDLKKQFFMAFRKLKTPAFICEQVLECLENRDKKLSDKTEQYFVEEFKGSINKYWTDDIIKFIKLRY